MFAALILTALLAPMDPEAGPAQIKVGPIYLGERIKAVQRDIGPGWRGSVDAGNGVHLNALVYTDGADQLEIFILPTTNEDEVVLWIVARENRPEGGTLRYPTRLRDWRWDLGKLFEMPVASRGWAGGCCERSQALDVSIADYGYGHDLSVWFTNNRWRGVDFHIQRVIGHLIPH